MLSRSAPSSARVARRGFVIGWLSIALVTASVFAIFAGPLVRDGHAATLSEVVSAPVLAATEN